MIIDNLKNLSQYSGMEKFKVAFDYVEKGKTLPIGKHIIDDNNFLLVQEYYGKEDSLAKAEAHKKYIDIQIVVSGIEKMGVTQTVTDVLTLYSEEKDIVFYTTDENESLQIMTENTFAVLYPTDIHRPGIKLNGGLVKKLVFKVKI